MTDRPTGLVKSQLGKVNRETVKDRGRSVHSSYTIVDGREDPFILYML